MADSSEGGEFSDDELDGLDADDILALEHQAVARLPAEGSTKNLPISDYPQVTRLTTSHAPVATRSYTEHNYAVGHDHQDEVGEASQTRQEAPSPKQPSLQNATPVSEAFQREQWRLNRFGRPAGRVLGVQQAPNVSLPHRSAGTAGPAITASTRQPQQSQYNQANSVDLQSLQAELQQVMIDVSTCDCPTDGRQLRLEKEGLQNVLKAANEQVQAKAGEISIIRSNQAKIAKDYEKRIDELQKQHSSENEKHKAEVEQTRKEKEKLVTHNQFLDHEMNDQAWQLRQAQKAKNSGSKPRQGGIDTTPKKTKALPFGDGFNNDEVTIVSPSKVVSKGKATTPKAGSKRKRDVLKDSPSHPIEFSQAGNGVSFEADQVRIKLNDQTTVADNGKKQFKFLQQLLDRRLNRENKRTFETLANYNFPSDQRNTLSSLLIDRMTPRSVKQDLENFPEAVGEVVLTLWSRCLQEKLYEPLRYLLDLIRFILLEGRADVASRLMDELVDLTQTTADMNVMPRYKRFKRKTATDDADSRTLNKDIDTQECLQLLALTINLCRRDEDLVKRFWRSMRFDFVSMLLRNSQDINDIIATVRLLHTSARIDSFAMIVAPPASQSVCENHVIDRLTSMMIEVPRVLEGEKMPNGSEIANLRLEILALVEVMCEKQYCGEAFAKHPSALSRLVRVMHDELNNLYEWKHDHELRAELVNQSTRLLYHLTTEYSEAVGDLQEKLRSPPTSVYKHLIVLSRLAFSEGIFFEADIEEDVLDMAHKMLEELVTPEEGEALQKAFVREEKQVKE